MEILRIEGEEFTSIKATFGEEGHLLISGQDMGPLVEQWWHDDDYEYFLWVTKDDVQKFTLLCLKEGFNKIGKMTFDGLMDICKENNINYKFDSWA